MLNYTILTYKQLIFVNLKPKIETYFILQVLHVLFKLVQNSPKTQTQTHPIGYFPVSG